MWCEQKKQDRGRDKNVNSIQHDRTETVPAHFQTTSSKWTSLFTLKLHMTTPTSNSVIASNQNQRPQYQSLHSAGQLSAGPVPCTCGRQFGRGARPRTALSALGPTESAGPGLAPPCCWTHWWTRSSQRGRGAWSLLGVETLQDWGWGWKMGSGAHYTKI